MHVARYHARLLAARIASVHRAEDIAARLAEKPLRARRFVGELVREQYCMCLGAVAAALAVASNGYCGVRDALSFCIATARAAGTDAGWLVIDRAAGALAIGYYGRLRFSDALSGTCARIAGAVVAAHIAVRNAVLSVCRAGLGLAVQSYLEARNAARRCVDFVIDTAAGAAAVVVGRYTEARDVLLLFVSRIVDRVTAWYWVARMVWAEIKRHGSRQLLPKPATPFIAAALVCLVLFVFGINSYFVISDASRKGIFMDLSRYEWGDEALASILIGEGYDIYLNEKITEKRIRELLASGHYYERVIRVTGYYSPLPDQEKYATGSYRGDIILNGRGIMASDTTPVYIGMAAGPPHMEFGTNVIIEDLAKFDLPKIYTVHDRGGAIKGNRLDIWVGKGEKAMKKAYDITGYYKVIVVGDR